ncbi:MAG: CRISPR-associated protein Cas4 [Salinivirgaceae bacterium]|nr:CRISPR-associated protein Cas4 [Salinivirgaceae bacterium]
MQQVEEYLLLSGIQHIAFCERQFALIHVEQSWAENVLTAQGRLVHNRVDNPELSEKRALIQNLKSLPVISHKLRLQGVCDVVEKSGEKIYPIEYKHGEPKRNICDEVQLCAQAICLEEMYNVEIPVAYLYYAKTRHRHVVILTPELREATENYALRMQEIFNGGKTPLAIYKAHCKSCSLYNLCLPKSFAGKKSASEYNQKILNDLSCENS